MDNKELNAAVVDSFHSAVARGLKLETIRQVIPVPIPKPITGRLFSYPSDGTRFVTLQEYAEYLNITRENVVEKARDLGFAVATMYNAMVKNARMKGDACVIDLVANDNLHFNFVLNSGASAFDPEGLIPGWIAFKFMFASFTIRPPSLADNSEVVKFALGRT